MPDSAEIRLEVDGLFESFACLERRELGSFDVDFLAGTRIATFARAADAVLERSEADNLNSVAFDERLFDCVEERADSLVRFFAVDARLLSDRLN